MEIFFQSVKYLACGSCVERWRGQLHQIRSQILAATLYRNLRILLEEPKVDTFLLETIEQLSTSETTKSFCTYTSNLTMYQGNNSGQHVIVHSQE